LLCSPAQAEELDLGWRPIGEIAIGRGFALAAAGDGNPQLIEARLGDAVARCLGAGTSGREGT
jgi:hypothetical protein